MRSLGTSLGFGRVSEMHNRASVADETDLLIELPFKQSDYRIRIIGTVGPILAPTPQMNNRTAGFKVDAYTTNQTNS